MPAGVGTRPFQVGLQARDLRAGPGQLRGRGHRAVPLDLHLCQLPVGRVALRGEPVHRLGLYRGPRGRLVRPRLGGGGLGPRLPGVVARQIGLPTRLLGVVARLVRLLAGLVALGVRGRDRRRRLTAHRGDLPLDAGRRQVGVQCLVQRVDDVFQALGHHDRAGDVVA